MKEKENPAAGMWPASGAAEIEQRRNYVPPGEKIKQEFWLHIRDDGREVRFASEPWWLLTLRVRVIRLDDGSTVQETYTRNLEFWSGAFGEIRSVIPRGEGWALFDSRTSDKWTSWRRIARRKP